jgi:hypothetical protein
MRYNQLIADLKSAENQTEYLTVLIKMEKDGKSTS